MKFVNCKTGGVKVPSPCLALATFQPSSYVSPPLLGRFLQRDPRRKSRSGLGLIGRNLGILPSRRGGNPGADWPRAASVWKAFSHHALRPSTFSQPGARRRVEEVGGAEWNLALDGGLGRVPLGGPFVRARISALCSPALESAAGHAFPL